MLCSCQSLGKTGKSFPWGKRKTLNKLNKINNGHPPPKKKKTNPLLDLLILVLFCSKKLETSGSRAVLHVTRAKLVGTLTCRSSVF